MYIHFCLHKVPIKTDLYDDDSDDDLPLNKTIENS